MNQTNQHNDNDFETLCAGYVLGSLDPEETKEFEKMLPNASEDQKKLYNDLLMVHHELALVPGPVSPPAALEDEIIRNLPRQTTSKPEKQNKPDSSIRFMPGIYKAAAAILLIAALSLSYISYQLSNTVDSQQTQLSELRTEMERQEQLLNILSAREVTFVNMDGLDPSPEGYGKIIWDPEQGRAVLQLANLPTPPADRDYQLWLIKEGENPISAGVFNFDQPSTDLFFQVEQLNERPSELSNTFAVTLEPKGGVPQPTGDMFLAGVQN